MSVTGEGGDRGRGASRRAWLARVILLLVVVVVAASYGSFVRRTGVFPHRVASSAERWGWRTWERIKFRSEGRPSGRWAEARGPAASRELTDAEQDELEALMTLGYVSGSKPASDDGGVTYIDPERVYDGYNLYTSGHAAEALLLDMNGRTLHRWSMRFLDVWPDYEGPGRDHANKVWRRVHLYDNGDILAIFENVGIVKLDSESTLLWSHAGGEHHDLDVADDGSIYVIQHEKRVVPRVHAYQPVSEDFIAILEPDGKLRKRLSILEAFERSDYRAVLESMSRWGDILHTNTIEILDGSRAGDCPAFRKGNVLICVRQLDTIAVVDMEEGKVVWALTGRWRLQHQPTFIPGGNMLIFNNRAGLDAHGEPMSAVLEFDPLTQETYWTYDGNMPGGLYSPTCGSCERLPNGNTLITETDNGRAIEVTPAGRVVWEFINPKRAGKDDQLIASLYEVIRIPPDARLDWMSGD